MKQRCTTPGCEKPSTNSLFWCDHHKLLVWLVRDLETWFRVR